MPIQIECSCGKTLLANDTLAGKAVTCPWCQTTHVVPVPAGADPNDMLDFVVAPPEPGAWTDPLFPEGNQAGPRERPTAPQPAQPAAQLVARVAAVGVLESPLEGRWLAWWLVLALVPLAWSLTWPKRDDVEDRLRRTVERAPAETQALIAETLLEAEKGQQSGARLFDVLPGQKLVGAHLARRSTVHWLYAVLSLVGFLLLVIMFAPLDETSNWLLAAFGLLAAIAGLAVTALFQTMADVTMGPTIASDNPFVLSLYYLARVVGYSHRAAFDPGSNLLVSFLAFTLGVGLCLDLLKAAPLWWKACQGRGFDRRTAFAWGLASGVGLGVGESVAYASAVANGVDDVGSYCVRFVSCVALNAIWGASMGMVLHRHADLLVGTGTVLGGAWRLVLLLSGPLILHGLFDTLLKKEYNAWALLVALGSLGWMAWQWRVARLAALGDVR